MGGSSASVLRLAIVLAVGLATAAAGLALFWWLPDSLVELAGIVLAVLVGVVGLQLGLRIARQAVSDYDVAEVGVEGPIVRGDGGSPTPTTPSRADPDDVVEQIERADEDDAADALLLHMNTPGGEVVGSEDVRAAAADFDGPTIAYASDQCASGGMWIASGCDALWAREGSVVGSIGVLFSQVRLDEFAERHGVSYERIVSGDYKDAVGMPFKEMEPDERAYVQALSDAWYEQFVDRVADAWDMDADAVRETEARVYLGAEAVDVGFVDALGDREDVEAHLADELGRQSVTVERFEPERSLSERLQAGGAALAYAAGAGLASVATDDGLRMR